MEGLSIASPQAFFPGLLWLIGITVAFSLYLMFNVPGLLRIAKTPAEASKAVLGAIVALAPVIAFVLYLFLSR